MRAEKIGVILRHSYAPVFSSRDMRLLSELRDAVAMLAGGMYYPDISRRTPVHVVLLMELRRLVQWAIRTSCALIGTGVPSKWDECLSDTCEPRSLDHVGSDTRKRPPESSPDRPSKLPRMSDDGTATVVESDDTPSDRAAVVADAVFLLVDMCVIAAQFFADEGGIIIPAAAIGREGIADLGEVFIELARAEFDNVLAKVVFAKAAVMCCKSSAMAHVSPRVVVVLEVLVELCTGPGRVAYRPHALAAALYVVRTVGAGCPCVTISPKDARAVISAARASVMVFADADSCTMSPRERFVVLEFVSLVIGHFPVVEVADPFAEFRKAFAGLFSRCLCSCHPAARPAKLCDLAVQICDDELMHHCSRVAERLGQSETAAGQLGADDMAAALLGTYVHMALTRPRLAFQCVMRMLLDGSGWNSLHRRSMLRHSLNKLAECMGLSGGREQLLTRLSGSLVIDWTLRAPISMFPFHVVNCDTVAEFLSQNDRLSFAVCAAFVAAAVRKVWPSICKDASLLPAGWIQPGREVGWHDNPSHFNGALAELTSVIECCGAGRPSLEIVQTAFPWIVAFTSVLEHHSSAVIREVGAAMIEVWRQSFGEDEISKPEHPSQNCVEAAVATWRALAVVLPLSSKVRIVCMRACCSNLKRLLLADDVRCVG